MISSSKCFAWRIVCFGCVYLLSGSPIGMQYRDLSSASSEMETYWFEKNMQGDIVAVYDTDGVLLISYTYYPHCRYTK